MADTPAAKPFPIPLSYFGIALGTAGLGMSWRYAATVGQAPAWPGEGLLALAGVVWLLLMLAWFTKFLAFRQAFRADFQDLVQCCFISLIPITTIMSGLSLRPYAAAPAEVLIYLGIVGQLVFAMYRAAGLWRGLHTSKATTPIIYLPTVATSFVSAMAMSAMQQPEIATLFFGAGVLSWMSLEAAILGRLRTETAIDPKVRGIIGIQLAPAFVGCSAYFGINGGQVDMVALMLIGYGTLQLLFLLRLLPWVLEGGFTMSLWGLLVRSGRHGGLRHAPGGAESATGAAGSWALGHRHRTGGAAVAVHAAEHRAGPVLRAGMNEQHGERVPPRPSPGTAIDRAPADRPRPGPTCVPAGRNPLPARGRAPSAAGG